MLSYVLILLNLIKLYFNKGGAGRSTNASNVIIFLSF